MTSLERVCVYSGSNTGRNPAYAAAAIALARSLVARGVGIVYGAGNVGLMGVLADAALAAGGEVIGVIPDALVAHDVAHDRLTELRVVRSMHERKAMMAELSSAFVALPGGVGTVEELVEVLTWTQLGLHDKPCALLDVDGYYASLVAFFDHTMEDGFIRPEHRALLVVGHDVEDVLTRVERWQPAARSKWIDRDDL